MAMRGKTLAKVEVLVAGNSSCGIDGAVGGEQWIGMVVGAGAGGEVQHMSVRVWPNSEWKTGGGGVRMGGGVKGGV